MTELKQGDKVRLASSQELKEVFAANGTFEEGNRNEKAEALAGTEGTLDSVSGNEVHFRSAVNDRVVCIPSASVAEVLPEVEVTEESSEEKEASEDNQGTGGSEASTNNTTA